MNRAALAFALVLGTATTAAADGIYFSEALGGTKAGNEIASEMGSAFRVRIAVGYRLSTSWAIEGWFAGDLGTTQGYSSGGYEARTTGGGDCIDCGGYGGSYDYGASMASVGFDVKYLRPMSKRVELYLRGSLGKGWLDSEDYSGRGLGIGAGAQIKGKVPVIGFLFWPLFFTNWGPKVTAALFVDAGADFYRLHKHGQLDNPDSIDATFHRLTIGWAVGADF